MTRLTPSSLAAVVLVSSVLFFSCVGLDAKADIRADGSGAVSIDYRVSRLVESMGKLEGTDRWLPLPFERNAFERAVRGIGGLALTEFSVDSDESEIKVKAILSFADLGALVRFINATGRTATLNENGGKRSITFRVSEGGGPLDPELKRLVDAVFNSYVVSLRFKLPSAPSTQGGGSVDAVAFEAVFTAAVTEILSSEKPIVWGVSW